MITASEVPFATASGTEKNTTSAGMITIPPPTPRRPARTPETTPMATRARASQISNRPRPAGCDRFSNRRMAVATRNVAKSNRKNR